MVKESKIKLPKVSFVICTLNCKDFIVRCIESIRNQDYPKNKIEILVVDSYSTDGTIEEARKLGAKVILTKIRGYMEGKGMPKSLGVSKAKGDIIITIDSDNALVEEDWIKKTIYPLISNKSVDYAISRMAVVKTDNLVNQYLSLVGTDPFAIYASLDPQISLGNVKLEDKGSYYIYKNYMNNFLITGGYYLAFRKETLRKIGGYTRDVDVAYNLARDGFSTIAIPKEAHLHHLITPGFKDFVRKKAKWARHYFKEGHKEKEREFKWNTGLLGRFGKLNFYFQVIKNIFFIPEFIVSLKMFYKEKNKAWLIHSPMVFATTLAYMYAFIQIKFFSKHK